MLECGYSLLTRVVDIVTRVCTQHLCQLSDVKNMPGSSLAHARVCMEPYSYTLDMRAIQQQN